EALGDDAVGVEEQHGVATRGAKPDVGAGAEAAVVLGGDEGDALEAVDHASGVVAARRVVDYDHLRVTTECLQAPRQEVRGAVVHDHDGQVGGGGHRSPVTTKAAIPVAPAQATASQSHHPRGGDHAEWLMNNRGPW